MAKTMMTPKKGNRRITPVAKLFNNYKYNDGVRTLYKCSKAGKRAIEVNVHFVFWFKKHKHILDDFNTLGGMSWF